MDGTPPGATGARPEETTVLDVVYPFLIAPSWKPWRRRFRLRRPQLAPVPCCTTATSRWFTCRRVLPCTSHGTR